MWILPEQKNGFLDDTQKAQVRVLFNALQPGDASRKVPNAEQSGAIHFIDLLLARDASVFEDIPKWKVLYPKALQALEEQSVLLFSKSLKDLTADEATSLIAKLETGALVNFQAGGEKLDQPFAFDTLRRHCIQGCFADTRWGGNTNRTMWKWFGYQEETKELLK
jgi:gluconate 2-dehydrogenase gamma chain